MERYTYAYEIGGRRLIEEAVDKRLEQTVDAAPEAPAAIQVRGARVHNLKNIDVDIPLNRIVGVAGVSGSGKSSLALGVLYAEGSRRYLESLSTYTRRRMTQAAKADVDQVLYVPAALALHQRPGVPGIRSTFGTGTELLNSLRLMFSRLASHRCPNGHMVPPSLGVAAGQELVCPECGEHFYAPGAEELAFNSQGACRNCGGTGTVRTVDRAALIPDESLTIDEGAVAPWNSLMWSLMTDVCRAMGVRTDVPFRDLTDAEKEIVYDGPMVKKHIFYHAKGDNVTAGELDFTYYSAVNTVLNALSKVKDEKGMKRVEKFLKEELCPECGGTRLSEAARAPRLRGLGLDEVCQMSLKDLCAWVAGVPGSLPAEMRPMAKSICDSFAVVAQRLNELGLSYLTLDRASSTLSTGERQRMQLARAVRNRTTGVLYVLDEPSIGLHPANIVGLNGVMHDLVADGNSVLLVDHDPLILGEADWIIELGPEAGAAGGEVLAQGTVPQIVSNPISKIGPFLANHVATGTQEGGGERYPSESPFPPANTAADTIRMETTAIHTVKPLEVLIPKGKLTVVTGVSGSGKTTMVLESLVPALEAITVDKRMPDHVTGIEAPGIARVKLIDATPIGINVRSTVATYAGVHDELRKIYARSPEAKARGYKSGDFSYNTGSLRCPVCDGTGSISLDVQFLPDVDIPCPECRGSRYARAAYQVPHRNKAGESLSLPQLMDMDVNNASWFCRDMKTVAPKLEVLCSLGLGYLTLGEETPSLSGGEAQRLKLASEMGRSQSDTVFVFDEPTIGLHPLDVRTLLEVFRTLIANGATVLVIEHDLDVIRHADWIIDMGPGGGDDGGRIIACGTPAQVATNPDSITGRFI
ncbi:MAG: excinuclease ABC subunit UvrA [Coriobacteriales bacterium]|nr:excinuclease ABC subunit UvrA [Coriobacteriales bacterium]MBQ6586590.1 excinuclease ABC subunit UvrA [Coriobacteriales bacterium]